MNWKIVNRTALGAVPMLTFLTVWLGLDVFAFFWLVEPGRPFPAGGMALATIGALLAGLGAAVYVGNRIVKSYRTQVRQRRGG